MIENADGRPNRTVLVKIEKELKRSRNIGGIVDSLAFFS